MESVSRNGRTVVGFGLATNAPATTKSPLGKLAGFGIGVSLTAMGAMIGATISGKHDNTILKEDMPMLAIACLGGGIAGAIMAPHKK